MKISKKRKSCCASAGFTLIELIVVVGIIGIIAGIVLTQFGYFRFKGVDAGVKANLNSIRSQAEIFYIEHSSYLPLDGSATSPYNCSTIGGSSTSKNMFSNDAKIKEILAEVSKIGAGVYCANDADTWATAVGLKSEKEISSWCVDSRGGDARVIKGKPDSAINNDTFSCKPN
jgi:prepilin-type N-terminal cleavage/methylation domain-containing protein